MKKIILKGGIFLVIILIILWLLNEMLPFSWGNRMLHTKVEYLNKDNNKQKFNSFFLGSSTTYRHIIPSLFDSLLQEQRLVSFNLGTDGCYPTHIYNILENVLKESNEDIKYIFVTISTFDPLPETRFHSTKTKYFTKLKWYYQELKYLFYLEADNKKKADLLRKYSITYWENIFKINMRRDVINYIVGKGKFGESVLGKNKDGYRKLPGKITEIEWMAKTIPKFVGKTKRSWSTVKKDQSNYNKGHLDLIENLITKSKENGTHLVFILPPARYAHHATENYDQIYSLYGAIDEKHKIELCDPAKYPTLYNSEYYWDASHFNSKGARIYTRLLGEEVRRLLEDH